MNGIKRIKLPTSFRKFWRHLCCVVCGRGGPRNTIYHILIVTNINFVGKENHSTRRKMILTIFYHQAKRGASKDGDSPWVAWAAWAGCLRDDLFNLSPVTVAQCRAVQGHPSSLCGQCQVMDPASDPGGPSSLSV